MKIIIKKFEDLTIENIYSILQLRSEVFVVEQNCVYQDLDNKDQIAYHVIGIKNNQLIAYSRIFDSGDYFAKPSIGRIVVKKEYRGFSLGYKLVKESIVFIEKTFTEKSILISAQKYLTKFYNTLGFVQQGEEYLEDGIPHVKMIRK
ncbi:MAG: Acetyltransferase [Flavobacterium sp. SCGC AAA160-P02]|nr:MAG: Acetyltransferase [Flavobacterium sp. SCGC AAA160-P02]|tara:strand:- start:417 stop:857 length:441 start_codon:yes stop_codon:yes gene_type:complete